jgi:RimJ/RimL family protein N-acetyltransferase
MGRWSVIRKSDQQFLGWCGLKLIRDDNTVDLGYRFHQRFWKQGYATETGKACLHYGFEQLKLQRIVGRAEKANKASIHVLEKCGMQFVEEMMRSGTEQVLYEILKPTRT